MSQESIAQAVGHIPSGLFIVCSHDKDKNTSDGFLGSWVQQVSFYPLLVTLCIKPGRPAYDHIMAKRVFSINVVGEHEKSVLKSFWSGYDPNKNPFENIPHHITADGALIMTQAKSTIVCRCVESFKPGDHQLVVAEVTGSVVHDEAASPMVHVRKSGLTY